jgi:cytochrome b561
LQHEAGRLNEIHKPMRDSQHSSDGRYTLTARVPHWMTAVLVLLQIPAGLLIANFDLGPLYDLHKSVGIVILALMLACLGWRLQHPPPPLQAYIPSAQRLAAAGMHWTLYVLIVAQSLLGCIGTSAYPAPAPFFGLFTLPQSLCWPLIVCGRYVLGLVQRSQDTA